MIHQQEGDSAMKKKLPAFAAQLARLREGAGLTQYALAKKSGLTKQAISRLEMGTRDPGWETVQRLALALGVDYGAFADPEVRLPDPGEARRPGRPRKVPPASEAAPEPAAVGKPRRRRNGGGKG
jgi:transcriptional regulator with XRE-family HTH domain